MGKPRMVLVGGRFVPVEGEKAKAKELAEAAGLEPGRNLIAVDEEGKSRLVHPEEEVEIREGMRFEDAPPAAKG